MDRDELGDWLRLTLTPGAGPATARKLLAAFGLPSQLFQQPRSALAQVVGESLADRLLTHPPELSDALERTWQWLCEPREDGARAAVLTLGDAGYPAALLDIEDPPLMLYLLGALDWVPNRPSTPVQQGNSAIFSGAFDATRSVAVVGSRNPTPQGRAHAHDFSQALAEAGLTIVSGLALGIDAAAHQGALAAARGPGARLATVAVVGTGLDRVYPKSHLALARQIVQNGVMVSEYPLGTPPLAANFPRRNRLIAGLSRGTLVVEAALESGSLITARLAAEQGKEVYAIPGSIHSPQARGCHALIRQGAKLVESAQDVLEDLLGPSSGSAPGVAQSAERSHSASPVGMAEAAHPDPVLDALGQDPVGLDALLARSGLDSASLQAALTMLELDGSVARLPGGLYQRVVRR
ncbi:MAG: DNA-protecting protein DprA [Rhodoferax sp.]|nr:DNA-protecting protein DprA [Rhodoferax sp.]